MTLSGKVNEAVKTTKASLDEKGMNLTAGGLSIKTDQRMDREAYLDATQRGAINVMKAASFGPQDHKRSMSDIDKHIRNAPDSPQDHKSAKKRSLFGKSKSKAVNQ
ncbi:hypothetical protein CPB86DRAFT_781727 [Serendipita vermifera]|nr:hypothetical protein CPB86DRAFT_781727 [Serendipita vermifera]